MKQWLTTLVDPDQETLVPLIGNEPPDAVTDLYKIAASWKGGYIVVIVYEIDGAVALSYMDDHDVAVDFELGKSNKPAIFKTPGWAKKTLKNANDTYESVWIGLAIWSPRPIPIQLEKYEKLVTTTGFRFV